MISLNYKQVEDLKFLSGINGGKSVRVEKVWDDSGTRIYAYIGHGDSTRAYHLPPKAKMRELKHP